LSPRRILLLFFLCFLAACSGEPVRGAGSRPGPRAPPPPDDDDGAIRIKGSTRHDTAPVATRTNPNQAKIDALKREALESRGKGANEASWKIYTSAEGRFQVSMPERPDEKSSLDMNVLVLELPESKRLYEVGYRKLDQDELSRDPDSILDERLRQLVRRHSDARLATSRPIATIGRPGRDARIETPLLVIAVRLFLVDDRLLEVLVKTAPAEASSKDVGRFFDSFRLTS